MKLSCVYKSAIDVDEQCLIRHNVCMHIRLNGFWELTTNELYSKPG